MKSSIFKASAVVIMVVSVAFMGMSIAAYYGRPDAASAMIAPEMQDYTFERAVGENITWNVTRRVGDKGSVGSFKTPYEALLKAHADLVNRKNSEASEAKTRLDALKDPAGQIATFKASQEQDEAAMRARAAALQQVVQQFEGELLKKSDELQALSVQSKSVRDETALRRTDVIRLRNELEEARTDLYRLTEIRRVLTDRLLRLQLDNQALADRKSQLDQQVAQ